MRIVVTGAAGFLGRNLCIRLSESGYGDVLGTTRPELGSALRVADFVFHLAGVNRPQSESEFLSGNLGFTEAVCAALASSGRRIPIAFASSTQTTLDNAYGRSKRAAEEVLLNYSRETGAPVRIFRLTNVFGKWSRPYYNSAVATFCYQIARGLPATVNDPSKRLRLLYVDDVIDALIALLGADNLSTGYGEVGPVYETSVGEVVGLLGEIANCRNSLLIPRVGAGFMRALYSTYISFLPPEAFAYAVQRHVDPRGTFVEMLRTPDCGQFSYFTAHPGITRGEHYHHTKTEKFLIVRGTARFGFRNLNTGETHELIVHGAEGNIVESVPGWAHSVTNIGEDELIVMLWANEVFDRSRPDTVAVKVVP
jgi:UDP-2-acetamido-2,6-beta-L-arabino-hexul-4-ose reductase